MRIRHFSEFIKSVIKVQKSHVSFVYNHVIFCANLISMQVPQCHTVATASLPICIPLNCMLRCWHALVAIAIA